MGKSWIAKRLDADGERFELHLGGNIYVLSLEEGERIARDILGLLNVDEFCPACDAGAGHCIGHHEDNDEIPF